MKTPKCNCKPFDSHFEFQHEQRTTVICKDKGSKPQYIYENQTPDYLSKYRVDGGLIDDAGAKCDYLLLNCNKSQSFFIELKGSDIIHAIEQIDRSIDLLKDKLAGLSVFARIVVTRVNTIDLIDTKYLRLKKKVERLNGNLLHKSRELRETNP
jgi:hypothetical protein